ncbi:hypothetical protein CUJ83_03680 [Methanocella sp. CWC-04]|uniref:Uncharacterized protein n=1 Tax=Methanooceanicella nereidis TaxID=2052831 RepID=A0AAP2RAT8_9EURY|nr:hypothetical protein [Methanocella sp. CWC-04]MCD1294094.1 hypothetical protein [Methanocella sp. CWC-04]
MSMSRILIMLFVLIMFVIIWRLIDLLLGTALGIFIWALKTALFLILMYAIYILFIRQSPVTA